VSGSTVLATPTLVSSWTEFVTAFGYGTSIDPFKAAGVGTAADNLKYAVKTFFLNGGSQAYISRVVNTDAVKASVSLRDSNASITSTAGWTLTGNATTSALTIATVATTGSPFSGIVPGTTLAISGVTSSNYSTTISSTTTNLNGKSWVVSDVAANGQSFSLLWKGSGSIPLATQASGITISGAFQSTTPTLTITAKDHGAWGNKLWAAVTPNSAEGFFDLTVYFSLTASTSSALTDSDRVERFTQLSMSSTSPRYVLNNVQSNWITVADNASAATGNFDLPAFTGYWSTATTSNNTSSVDGSFQWNNANFSNTVTSTSGGTAVLTAVPLGVTASSQVTTTGVIGSNGSAAPTLATQILPAFDSISEPLTLNYPAKTDTTSVNAMLSYAATRGNAFVIIDAANTSVANVLSTTTDVGIGSYTTNRNYGAVYYPNIVVPDYASSTGATKSIPAGGAVAAVYVSTDQARGVFKAPAGTSATIAPAVSITALTNDDFNAISGYGNANLNIIRFVPGAGICVMGARTLTSTAADIYVPVRRSLNYLNYALKNVTLFSVFEPNDKNLWRKVTGVVEGLLYDFWREGGLVGTNPTEAFYVKCDSTVNTPASISAGELRIEVGVALQRPAEFVVIKLGQTSGGTTITTSI
jgi:phage tail sheath protein FI